MTVLARAGSVSCPEPRSIGLKERVALAFEGSHARNIAHCKTRFAEPAAKMRFLALPLPVMKTAERDDAVAHQARVCSEHHVRRSRLPFDEMDLGNLAQRAVQLFPLLARLLPR